MNINKTSKENIAQENMVFIYGADLNHPRYDEMVAIQKQMKQQGKNFILIPEPNEHGQPTGYKGAKLDMSNFNLIEVQRTLEKYFSIGGEKGLQNKNFTVINYTHGTNDRNRILSTSFVRSISADKTPTKSLYKTFLSNGQCNAIVDLACFGGSGMLDLKEAIAETNTSRKIHFVSMSSAYRTGEQFDALSFIKSIPHNDTDITPFLKNLKVDKNINCETVFDGKNIDEKGNVLYRNYRKYFADFFIEKINFETFPNQLQTAAIESRKSSSDITSFFRKIFEENIFNPIIEEISKLPYNSLINNDMSRLVPQVESVYSPNFLQKIDLLPIISELKYEHNQIGSVIYNLEKDKVKSSYMIKYPKEFLEYLKLNPDLEDVVKNLASNIPKYFSQNPDMLNNLVKYITDKVIVSEDPDLARSLIRRIPKIHALTDETISYVKSAITKNDLLDSSIFNETENLEILFGKGAKVLDKIYLKACFHNLEEFAEKISDKIDAYNRGSIQVYNFIIEVDKFLEKNPYIKPQLQQQLDNMEKEFNIDNFSSFAAKVKEGISSKTPIAETSGNLQYHSQNRKNGK